MSPQSIPILLASKLSPVQDWQRLRGAIVMANLEADFQTMVYWLQVSLVRSAPDYLSHQLTYDPDPPLPT